MSPEPLPWPDCFLRQGTDEIAADIGEAAVQTLEDFVDLREYVGDLVGDADPFDASADEVGQERDRLAARLRALGRIFETVAGWWVADQPPAFAPTCVSAVDAVAEAAAYLVACLEHPMPTKALPGKGGPSIPVGLEVQCRYAAKTVDVFSHQVAVVAIRCEAGVMSRRPPPPVGLILGYTPLDHQFRSIGAGFHSAHTSLELARVRIRQELPRGWDAMPDAARLKAIGVDTSAAAPPKGGNQPFVLRPAHRKILECLDGRAMVSSQLDDKTGLEHSQMMRAVKKLRELGLVAHLHGLGYYRPDRPPPDLPSVASGGATE